MQRKVDIENARRLFQEGQTVFYIANLYGASKTAVRRHIQDLLPVPHKKRIDWAAAHQASICDLNRIFSEISGSTSRLLKLRFYKKTY